MLKFGFDTPNFGPYSDPRTIAELAREAEASGWDGFFIWDHINVGWPDPVGDPWILLAAIAMATKRIRLGALVTPLARRSPWKVARETVTLDHLSSGRLVLGVGLGDDIFKELSTFAIPLDPRVRAAMLDEGLEVLTRLWSGKPVSFSGQHYNVGETVFLPTPVQTPRIPIWVGGIWPHKPPFRRAARFDGVAPIVGDLRPIASAEVREIVAYVNRHRSVNAPYDVICAGETAGDSSDADVVLPIAEAGATWWLEARLPWKTTVDQVRERIRKGPPRI